MKKMYPMLAIALAIVLLPAFALAEGEKAKGQKRDGEHKRPDVKAMFARIDADGNGQVSLEEIPQRMKERLGDRLAKADANSDKQLSLDEFKAMLKPRGDAEKGKKDRARPEMREKGKKDRPRPEMREKGKKDRPRPEMRDMGKKGHPRPDMRGKSMKDRPMPDIKAIFAKLDADGNSQLSLEEFTEGAKKMHERMKQHMDRGPMARGPMARGPMARGPMDKGRRPGFDREMAEKIRAKMDERFKAADKNGDGKLSKEEVPERLKDKFDKIDADKDGQLTRDELKKAFRDRYKDRDGKPRHPGKQGKDKPSPKPAEV